MQNKRIIYCPIEKCLDCWLYRRTFFGRFYRCIYGLIPVMKTIINVTGKGKKKKETQTQSYECYGYLDRFDKEAPAKRSIIKFARKWVKKHMKKMEEKGETNESTEQKS